MKILDIFCLNYRHPTKNMSKLSIQYSLLFFILRSFSFTLQMYLHYFKEGKF